MGVSWVSLSPPLPLSFACTQTHTCAHICAHNWLMIAFITWNCNLVPLLEKHTYTSFSHCRTHTHTHKTVDQLRNGKSWFSLSSTRTHMHTHTHTHTHTYKKTVGKWMWNVNPISEHRLRGSRLGRAMNLVDGLRTSADQWVLSGRCTVVIAWWVACGGRLFFIDPSFLVNSHLDHSRAWIPACSLTAAMPDHCFPFNLSTTTQRVIVNLRGVFSELWTLFIWSV